MSAPPDTVHPTVLHAPSPFKQQCLYHLQEESPNGYNVFHAYHVAGPTEVNVLSRHLNDVIKTHDILRTSFKVINGVVHSVLNKEMPLFVIPTVDLENKSSQEVSDFILSTVESPIDPSNAPLLRILLLHLAPQSNILLGVAHRLISDRSSLTRLLGTLFIPLPLTQLNMIRFPEFGLKAGHCGLKAEHCGLKAEHCGLKAEHCGESGLKAENCGESGLKAENCGESGLKAEHCGSDFFQFWKEKLGGSLQIPQLPLDCSRPSVQGFRCETATRLVGVELSDAVKKLAEQVGGESGLLITLLTIFKVILHRHTGEEDITVGAPRDTPVDGVSALLGPFEETVVYRTFVSDDLTFVQALETVEKTVKDTMTHFEPYYNILQVLYGNTVFSTHTPLFKTEFLLQDRDDNDLTLTLENGKIRLSPYKIPTVLSPYDLRLSISGKTAQHLNMEITYNSELFLQDRISEMFDQLELLMTQVVANPNLRIVTYSLVTPRAAKVLPSPQEPLDSSWNGSIQDHFAVNARKHPDKLAVFYEGHTVSYGQLFSQCNKLANLLISKGIKVGSVVGIYGHRSPAVVVAIMGILTSGASYCMMDPTYPTDRIQQCMEIAKPSAWIQIFQPPPDLQKFLDTLGLFVQVTIPQPWEKSEILSKLPETFPSVKVNPDSIAVITFTSGSTGIPKGVMGRHSPLTHYYPWMKEEFGILSDDRFSACSGIAHDPLQRDFFTPLFFGAHIYIPTQDDISQPGSLAKWFKTHEINVSCFTPAIGQLLTTGVTEDLKIPSLRLAFFVGDCLLKKDVILLHNLAPNITVINMYGSTETQRSVGYYKVPRALDNHKEVMIVGKGMRGCQLVLLNKDNKLAGIGEVAEIYVRSHHLALGYIGFPCETEKRFLKNNFVNTEGDRLYRTGDIGRYSLDGNLDCIGRADDQIKIRGFRIELGEISAALGKHPTVKENVTIVRQEKPGEKQLASYVVPWPEMQCDPVTIKAFLKAKLPHYMIPTYIIQLSALPLTPNGKIDRRGLPRPVTEEIEKSHLTNTQSVLLEIWTKLLGHPVPSIDSNFFDLGGHSLLVTQVTSEMQKIFKHDNISLALIFMSPTIKELSGVIDSLLVGDSSSTSIASIDYVLETRLSEDIRLRADVAPPAASIHHLLLTGGTGFLGAYLISQVLTQSSHITLYCLVRAKDNTTALSRLTENLKNHFLWDDSFSCRLVPLAGDLSREYLGLDRDQWLHLSSTLDAILHNGAMVHWLHPYTQLKSINVGGTIEVLRLACTTKIKVIHYVSTTNVFDGDIYRKMKVVGEGDLGLESSQGLKGGYTQTKWVAEQLVQKARARGLPSRIYRPSYVTGDSKKGTWIADDFLCRLIKGCIQLGSAPIMPGITLDMSPVDYVAKAIVYISLKKEEENFDFNVVQDNLYSYEKWFEHVKGYGYELEIVDYKKWRELLFTQANEENALKPFLSIFTEDWVDSLKGPRYDTTNTRKSLQNSGVTNFTMEQVMDNYFSYFIRCGFLTPPKKPLSDKVDWHSKPSTHLLQRNKNLF